MLEKLILQSIDLTMMKCAFFIKNLKSGEDTSYCEHEIVPSASLIKIPVMVEIMRQIKAGKLSLQQRIAIQEADKVPLVYSLCWKREIVIRCRIYSL